MFRKILVPVNVRIGESKGCEVFRLDPLLTVREAISFIEHSNFKSNVYNVQTRPPTSQTPNHELTLYTNSVSSYNLLNGIKLEYDRTVQSYRLTESDLLVLTSVQAKAGVWKGGPQSSEAYLIITAPEHNLQKVVFFFPSSSPSQ